MYRKEESIHIDAAPEVVFDYVSNIRRHPEWAAQDLVIEESEPGRFESVATIGPLQLKATTRIESSDRPHRLTYISDDGLAPHRWYFDITPEPGGSHVAFGMERLKDPLVVRVIQPLILYPIFGRPGMVAGLASIKRHLEAPQTQSTAASSAS
jgi:Polyketide cyclase / dehydrase and lipid transport